MSLVLPFERVQKLTISHHLYFLIQITISSHLGYFNNFLNTQTLLPLSASILNTTAKVILKCKLGLDILHTALTLLLPIASCI